MKFTIDPTRFAAMGSTQAFTAEGAPIVVERRGKKNPYTWIVYLDVLDPDNDLITKVFCSKQEAAEYASSLSDDAVTRRLAWWGIPKNA